MNILFVSSSFPNLHCGVGAEVYRLAQALTQLDTNVTVLTSRRKEIIEFSSSKQVGKVNVLPQIDSWDKKAIIRINELVNQQDFDVVHLHYHWWMYNYGFLKGGAFINIFKQLKKRGFRGKLITSFVHDLMGPYLFPKAGPLRQIFLRKLVNFSDHIIVHTEIAQKEMETKFTSLKGRIHRISCGPGILPRDSGLKVQHNNFVISFFGFIYPQKGLDYLLEALDILKQKNIKPTLMIIGGEDIEHSLSVGYARTLRQNISISGLEEQVKWLSYQKEEEVSGLLKNSDIAVLPFTEGMSDISTSMPTVLGHTLSLITTRSDRTPQCLINRENCLLVPPRDSHTLADAIKELFESASLRQKIALEGRKLYEREYSWDVIAEKTKEIYERSK